MTEHRGWCETVVAILIPPACREEVLGDLYERNASRAGYLVDAVRTVPMVIASRIRRTSSPRLLAMHAVTLYFSFYIAAWFEARYLVREPEGLWRLAIPCLAGLVALVLEDAYAHADRSPMTGLVRGPMLAIAAAMVLEVALRAGGSSFTLPAAIVVRGSAAGLVWTLILRTAFQPPSRSRRGRI